MEKIINNRLWYFGTTFIHYICKPQVYLPGTVCINKEKRVLLETSYNFTSDSLGLN